MSEGGLDVVLRALRGEARTWYEQGSTLAGVADVTESLSMSALQAGVFLVMRDAYGHAVAHVAARCREGAVVMSEVARALRANADAYERRDEEVSAHVAGAY